MFDTAAAALKPRLHDTTCCQSGLTTGWMFVYTIQPVVKPVWQPVGCLSCQTSCTTGLTTGCIV